MKSRGACRKGTPHRKQERRDVAQGKTPSSAPKQTWDNDSKTWTKENS